MRRKYVLLHRLQWYNILLLIIYRRTLLRDHHYGAVKGGLYEWGVNMGHTTFVIMKVGLTKEVVFPEGGLSIGVLLYITWA
jgi:hypothetical protein